DFLVEPISGRMFPRDEHTMPANSFPSKWSSDDVLKAVEDMPQQQLEELYLRLGKIRQQRHGGGLPARESALLVKINRGFPEAWWNRYHQLLQKRRAETLTRDEHRRLLRLSDQLENREASRLEALVQLANLRKCSLRALMKDLGLPAKTHG